MLADKLAALGLDPNEVADSDDENDEVKDKPSLPLDDSKPTTGKPQDG